MPSFQEVMENYISESEEDLNLNKADLEAKLREIPNLHNRWLRHFYTQSDKLIKQEQKLALLWRKKLNYYLFDYKYEVKHTQAKFYIESDEEYQKLWLQVEKGRKLVEMLERILKKVSNLSFDVNNILKFKELKAGK